MRDDVMLLEGAMDIHVHASPDRRERLLSAFDVAQQAKAAGMYGVVLKNHHTLSADQAEMTRWVVDGVQVLGGITLNYAVGGINPKAVEAAIAFGARIVWMPTLDAESHMRAEGKPPGMGISIFPEGPDHPGHLRPEVMEIIEMAAHAGIAVGTGHLSAHEVYALAEEAKKAGLIRLIVNHPQMPCVGLGPEAQREISDLGAYMEQCMNLCTPHQPLVKPDDIAGAIRSVGPGRCVMATDMGQVDSFSPVEGLRVFIRLMLDRGISAESIRVMVEDNPRFLLES